jgi:hypothetical protein
MELFMCRIKVTNIVRIHFVIQITIHTFVPAERLVFPASRHHFSSDPEEDLKEKSSI